MGDDDVLIKIATDIESAVRSLTELSDAFKQIFEGLKTLETQAGQTGISTEGVSQSIKTFIATSGEALEGVGTKLTAVGETLMAAAEKTGTTAEAATQTVLTIGDATDTAGGHVEAFATSVTTGMAGATEAISGTTETAGQLSLGFGDIAPAADQAAASVGPMLTSMDEGGKAAGESLGKLPITLDEVAAKTAEADAQQQSFFANLDAGTTATWGLSEAVSDLAQKRDEEAASFASFSDAQKQETAELTQALLAQGQSHEEIAAKAHMSVDALKLLNQEQADLKKKTEEAEAASKPFWDSWVNGVKTSEVATIAWGVVLGDVLKKLNEGIANAVTSFPAMISQMAAVGDNAKTMATQLGLSATEMAELKYISEQSGVPLNLMTKGLQTLSTQLADAGSKASTAVRSIGLIPSELAKLEGADRIAAINTAIQKMGEGFDGAGKYVEIFGQKGAKMAALVTEDVGKLNATFEELGGTENQQRLGDLGDEFNDLSNNVTVAMDSFKRSITVAFLPSVNAVLEKMPVMGGMFLSFGSIVTDAAKGMLPMITNMALMTAKEQGIAGLGLAMKAGVEDVKKFGQSLLGMDGGLVKFGKGIVALIPQIVTMTGAVIANTAAMLVNPYVLAAAAIAALGYAVYKIIAGTRSFTEVIEDLMEWLEPLTTFLTDLGIIVTELAEDAFGWLIKILGQASDYLSTFWQKTEEGVTWLSRLADGVKNVIEWYKNLPIIGKFVTKIIDAYKEWFAMVTKVWEKTKGFFSWLTGAVHDYANELTSEEQQAWWDQQQEQVAETAQVTVSATESMLAANKKLNDAYNNLSASMKANLTELLKNNSAKEIAENLSVEMGLSVEEATKVIERFDKALKDSAKSAKDNPFAKMVESAKELAAGMAEATSQGATAATMLDTYGKKADEVVRQALLMKNGLAAVAPEVIALGNAFAQAEFDKGMKAFEASAKAATKALKEGLNDALKETAQMLAGNVAESFLKVVAIQREMTEEGMTDSEKRMAQLKREEDAAIAVAMNRQGVSDQMRADELTAIGTFFNRKRDLENKGTTATKEAALLHLRTEQDKLAKLKALNDPFYADQIRQQTLVVEAAKDQTNDFERDMAARGVVTEKAAQQTLSIERDKLKALEDLHDPFYAEQIRAQKEVVDNAEVAAGKLKINFGGALSSIADAFAKLATISGDAFGGMLKNIGTVVGQANVMTTSFGDAAEKLKGAGGLKGIGSTFSNMMTGGTKDGKGGVMGLVGGLAKGLGSVVPMAGAIIAGVGAAIEIGKKLWDGLTESKGERAAKEIGRDFGVKITEEMGNAIADSAKNLFKNDIFTAKIYHMADIIKAAGGVTAKNFDELSSKLGETFQLVERGKMTADQGRQVLDQNFGAFAKHVVESGKVASKGFTDMLRRNAEVGGLSKEIVGFVESQTTRLGAAMSTLMAPFSKNIDLLKKTKDEAAKLQEELAKTTDPKAAGVLQAKLAELNQTIAGTTEKLGDSGAAMERFERLTLAGFNSAIKNGVGYLDALDAIGPALDQLASANTALGREGGAAIQELLRFREVATANKELVESAGALNEVMLALGNTGALNAATMADLQAQGMDTFTKLTEAGFTEQQSLQQMKGFLEQVRDAHTELGLPIDENTQALIDQAEEQGVLAKKTMSTNDIMMEGFSAIIKAVGGEVPEAFKKMAKAGVEAAKTVGGSLDTNVSAPVAKTQTELEKVKWQQYAQKGVLAAKDVAAGMAGVTGAVGGVQDELADTDWDAWAQEAVDAASEVKGAVDAVAVGESPGGIKDIPLKLHDAIKAFHQFEDVGVDSAESVKAAVDGMHGVEAGYEANIHAQQAQARAAMMGKDSIGQVHINIDRPILKDRQAIQELALEVAKNLKTAVHPSGAWK